MNSRSRLRTKENPDSLKLGLLAVVCIAVVAPLFGLLRPKDPRERAEPPSLPASEIERNQGPTLVTDPRAGVRGELPSAGPQQESESQEDGQEPFPEADADHLLRVDLDFFNRPGTLPVEVSMHWYGRDYSEERATIQLSGAQRFESVLTVKPGAKSSDPENDGPSSLVLEVNAVGFESFTYFLRPTAEPSPLYAVEIQLRVGLDLTLLGFVGSSQDPAGFFEATANLREAFDGELFPGRREWVNAYADPSGRLVFPGLTPGRWRVRIEDHLRYVGGEEYEFTVQQDDPSLRPVSIATLPDSELAYGTIDFDRLPPTVFQDHRHRSLALVAYRSSGSHRMLRAGNTPVAPDGSFWIRIREGQPLTWYLNDVHLGHLSEGFSPLPGQRIELRYIEPEPR